MVDGVLFLSVAVGGFVASLLGLLAIQQRYYRRELRKQETLMRVRPVSVPEVTCQGDRHHLSHRMHPDEGRHTFEHGWQCHRSKLSAMKTTTNQGEAA